MVSSISASTNLYELSANKNNTPKQNIASILDNFLASDYNKDMRMFDSKDEMLNYCSTAGVSTLEDFTCALGGIKGLDTKSINPESEYKEYMKSRGCDSDEELQVLNHTLFKNKAEMLVHAKSAIEGVVSSIEYSTDLSISNDTIDSLLSNADLKNIANYMGIRCNNENIPTYAGGVSGSVQNFQTLLSNISKQDNISEGYKNSLMSLSNNISNESKAINKWSAEVDAENARTQPMMDALHAKLIAQYQS